MSTTGAKKYLKTTYKVEEKIENFYTGGKVVQSESENSLACVCGSSIKVVDAKSGAILHTLEEEEDIITAIALSPNDKELISAGSSLFLKQWDLASKTVKRSWKAHNTPVISMCYDASCTLVATGGSADHLLKVWDIDKGHCTHFFRGHEGIISLVRFHPDPHRLQLFSCSDDCTVRMWDLVTKECVVFKDHMSVVTSLAFASNGWTLLTGGRDKVITQWDLRTKTKTKTIPVFESVEAIGVITNVPGDNSDSQQDKKKKKQKKEYILSGGEKNLLKVWDMESGQCLFEFNNSPVQFTIYDFIVCPKSNKLIVVTEDQNLLFFNLKTLEHERLLVGNNDEVIDIKYLEDNTHIAVATNSEQLRIFDLVNKSCSVLSGHTDIVLCVDIARKLPIIATAGKDHKIFIWNLNSHKKVGECVGHTEAVGCIAFSKRNNSGSAYLVSGSKDLTIKIWDITPISDDRAECKPRFTAKAHDKDINSVAVAPNDKLIASGSQDRLIKLWDPKDLSLIATLKGHKRGVWCVEFSPVDQCVASSSSDKTIKIWSVTDYTCLKTFEGHLNSVLRVGFITSGMQLVSSGSDGLVKLWTIKTNECVNTFDAHTEKVWALAIKNDDSEIISGGADSLINMWKDYTLIEEEEQIQQNQQRVLKEQELSNAVLQKNYAKAISLAFSLDQPFKLLTIFEEMLVEKNSADVFTVILKSFTADELERCLTYIRDWNSNAKHSLVAQRVLKNILTSFSPSSFTEKGSKFKGLFEALIPYSDRHFQRIDKLLQKSYLIDYTLHRMRVLLPAVDDMESEISTVISTETKSNAPSAAEILMMSKKRKGQQADEKSDDEDEEEDQVIGGQMEEKEEEAEVPLELKKTEKQEPKEFKLKTPKVKISKKKRKV